MSVLIEKQEPASKVLRVFEPYSQVLKNVKYDKKSPNPLTKDSVIKAIEKGEKILGNEGRVFIRKSGTEPLIRVMTESIDSKLTEKVAIDIITAIKAA